VRGRTGGKDGKERERKGRDRKMKGMQETGNGGEKREGGKWERKRRREGGGRKWPPHLSECGCASATRPKIRVSGHRGHQWIDSPVT